VSEWVGELALVTEFKGGQGDLSVEHELVVLVVALGFR
jgi:hypothetical protein